MKTIFTFSIFLLLAYCSVSQQYVQTFDGTEVAPVTTGTWTYTGSAISIATNVQSDGTIPNSTGSSANNNLLFSNCGSAAVTNTVLVTGIDMSSRTDIKLGFNLRRTGAYAVTTNLEFSNDGGTNWNQIADLGSLGSINWGFLSYNLPSSANNSNLSFRIRFDNILRSCTAAPNLRIDDFIVFYGSEPFPVTITSFSASTLGQQVILNWTTADESNFSHFSVERSFDPRNGFEAIGRIDAKASTLSDKTAYQFVDQTPNFGVNYYRLKQVDIDGSAEYSRIITANMTETSPIVIYPNPAADFIRLKNGEKEAIKSYEIYNSAGRLIRQNDNPVSEIKIQDLPSGMYFLQLKNERNVLINRRFIKI